MVKKNAKWIFIFVVCISLIIAGYNVYAIKEMEEKNMDHHHTHHNNGVSEVKPEVAYSNGELVIELKDKSGKVPELKVSHEKMMHLIVISSDLNDYHHLHPEEKESGKYIKKIDLPDGDYKVFVDIAPKDLNYVVQPININVGGTHKGLAKTNLTADTDFTKTINGQTVELITDDIETNKEVTFKFDTKDAIPQPYLGALGHVIITDEAGEKFIHVHPLSENDTVFVTQFEEPGLYKMWAEFKFGDEVNAYPFVIEVR